MAFHMHFCWSAPLGLLIAFVMAVSMLGTAMLPAMGVALLLLPINWKISK